MIYAYVKTNFDQLGALCSPQSIGNIKTVISHEPPFSQCGQSRVSFATDSAPGTGTRQRSLLPVPSSSAGPRHQRNDRRFAKIATGMTTYQELFAQCDPPYEKFDNSMLGPDFPAELDLVSRLWFRCGYRPGIGAYLNFFLLRDFITTHDTNYPPRFKTFKSMATSFYLTDLFIRDVTDSGAKPTGGISSGTVREILHQIQHRHQRVKIPQWMQTYFGFSLLENVEKQCAPMSDDEKRLHLAYMSKTYRIMGMPFSEKRGLLEEFSRLIEAEQAIVSPNVPRHSAHILRLGEMIGVSSGPGSILPMLPPKTRAVFEPLYPMVRPGPLRRQWSRLLGKLLMPKAVGAPRRAVPAAE
jgi:hypothetical protein